MPARETILNPARVLPLYRHAPLSARLYAHIRWRLFPFPALARHAPERGRLVDLGCGLGVWSFYLALRYPDAKVWGVDPDPRRIELARQIARANAIPNAAFDEGPAEDTLLPDGCAMVSLIDVMYLIPPAGQERLLAQAARQLRPGGRLLIKEMDERLRLKYAWNWFEEFLAVRLLRFTHGQRIHFRPAAEWERLLRGLGLRVERVPLDGGYPYPHLLFVGERPA